MTSKNPESSATPSYEEQQNLLDLAVKISARRIRREVNFPQTAEAIASKALESLLRAMKREVIHNPEAFMTWKIKNLIIDVGLARRVEVEQLKVHGHEFPRLEVVQGELVEGPLRGQQFRGISLEMESREEREVRAILAAAIIAIMPEADDRTLLRDRFYSPELSIADLARKHGGKSPNAMANYLKRILGNADEPGAVECVSHVIRHLSLRTAREFARILASLDELNVLTDPVGAAVGHLEFMATKSPSHRKLASKGVARLNWMVQHRPPNRRLSDKLLNRLVLSGCFYVLEANDARHDQFDELGLVDDIKVLDAIHQALRKFSQG